VNFLNDLRRRRMFRLVGLYVVGAWVVIQVAEALFQAWGIPDSAMRFIFIGAFLCFPIALVFGWIYDITSKGIVRTRAAGPEDTADLRLKRQDYLILSALLAVGLAVVLGSAEKVYEAIEESPVVAAAKERLENSIAILPFTNLDINADTQFFSDGVTEEILHRLSTQGALHVLASTSSFALRDSEEGPARISEILGVRYLLRGSVRRDNDYVRVTANLLDASGYAIWTQTFDRKLEGIFTIQSEIASTVSSEVLSEIVPFEDLPAGRTTGNMQAYEEYLIGRAFFNARPPGWQEQAAAAFRRAIELDDQFAPPYAGLAMSLYIAQNDVFLTEARSAAEKSLELDANLADGHAILGLILSLSSDEVSAGTKALQRALEIDPSFAIAHSWLASALYNQNLRAEGDAAMDRGLAIDPLNPTLSVNIANRESRNGNFERAEHLLLRLTQLPEPPGLALWELNSLYTDWGRQDLAAHWAKEIARTYVDTTEPVGFFAVSVAYERLGMSAEADYWMGILLENIDDPFDQFMFKSYLMRLRGAHSEVETNLQVLKQKLDISPPELPPFPSAIYAVSNILAGNYETGIQVFEAKFEPNFASFSNVLGSLDAIDMMHDLAIAYERVGQSDKSLMLLLSIHQAFEQEVILSASIPPGLEAKALNLALLGDNVGALQALQKAIDLGWTDYYWLVNDPAWADAIRAPELRELLAGVKLEVGRQRAIVEAADAEHDFRAEIEQLLSP